MILTCPKCATSYTIDEAHLGEAGRNVRCQSCRAVWFATRPEEPIELVAPAAPQPAPTPPPPREVKARELPKLYRQLIQDKQRLKALTSQGLIWGGMTLVFIAILAVGYAFRVDIVRSFPTTAKAFASIDPDIENDAIGMRLTPGQQKVAPSLKGGRFVFSVVVDVQNLKATANPLAPIRAQLLDAHGAELSNALVVLKDVTIDPHATRAISFDLPDPKNLGNSVVLSFDLMAMKELKDKSRYDKYYKYAADRANKADGHGGGEHGGGEHGAAESPADGHGAPEPAAESGHGPTPESHAPESHAPESHAPAAASEPAHEASHDAPPEMKPAASGHH